MRSKESQQEWDRLLRERQDITVQFDELRAPCVRWVETIWPTTLPEKKC